MHTTDHLYGNHYLGSNLLCFASVFLGEKRNGTKEEKKYDVCMTIGVEAKVKYTVMCVWLCTKKAHVFMKY